MSKTLWQSYLDWRALNAASNSIVGHKRREGGWFMAASALVTAAYGVYKGNQAQGAADAAAGASAGLVGNQAKTANFELQQAKLQAQRYWQTYAPIEKQLVKTAKDGPDLETELGKTTADVNAADKQAMGLMQANLSRYGVNPRSGQFIEANKEMGLQHASNLVGASAATRQRVYEDKLSNQEMLVNLGRGLPAMSNQSASIGAGTLANASQQELGIANMYGNTAAGYGQAVGTSLGTLADVSEDKNSDLYKWTHG